MNPPALRKLADRFERAGDTERARACRNRAAQRELGIELEARAAAGRSTVVQRSMLSAGHKKPTYHPH